MASWSLDDVRTAVDRALKGGRPPIGVGERAFPRFGPALFVPGYRIICALWTGDLPDMRGMAPVDCLEESAVGASRRWDTLAILSSPFLQHKEHRVEKDTPFLVYRETEELRRLALDKGWQLLANSSQQRARWENKGWFRSRLMEAQLPAAPWEVLSVHRFGDQRFEEFASRWGTPLVVQIPDFPRGGGRSTFFVHDSGEMAALRNRWQEGFHRGHVFREIMVSPFIRGPSISMEGCVTPWGVLFSPLQTQLVDLPQILPPGRWGRFCGHQWGAPGYPAEVESAARRITQRVGEALRSEGYWGIFGLDLALDAESGQVYGLECNPRYTGAFPALTLLQWAAAIPPLEAFHVMALLKSDIPVPVEAINEAAQEIPAAAQILLFHRGRGEARVNGLLAAGRYRMAGSPAVAERIGPALPLPPLPWNPREFVIADGPPSPGSPLLPGESLDRVLRILFLRPVLQANGSLDAGAEAVIRWAYEQMGLTRDEEDPS